MNQTVCVCVCVCVRAETLSFKENVYLNISQFPRLACFFFKRFLINNFVFVNITQYVSNTSKSVRICGFPFYSFFMFHSLFLSLFFFHDSF